MLNDVLLTPPVTFLIILVVVALLALLARGLQTNGSPSAGKGSPYASGQEVPTGRFQPGYDFFHIAFIFTMLEVVALLLGTVVANSIWLTVVVLSVVVLALIILFRKD